MRNKVTFNDRLELDEVQREKLVRVLGLYPADIVDVRGALFDLRVLSRRPIPRSYVVLVNTSDRWTFDYRNYIDVHPEGLVDSSRSQDGKFMCMTVQGEKKRVSYSFELR